MPAAALLLAALTACSPGTTTPPAATTAATSQAPAETATPSAEPTDSATAPPERPDAMSTPSADGASAAANYFMSTYSYMYATGDTEPWDELSSDTCEFCARRATDVERMTDAGNETLGDAITVESAVGVEIADDEWFSATLIIDEPASQEVDEKGKLVSESDGGRYELYFALSWNAGWRVEEVDVSAAPGS
ncbi:hypothetical protein GCM10023113_06320 [Cellulomonas oligotrophica]|uniref:DUF6318 domain-containing protein n=1 Tax=Cellulomonas oligotrophica TaxID=931536 RepID=A0ABQ4D9L9_9CELL|nr:hypothetical protein Col01nite_15730 [Cellulomonas oligotrophica]